MALTPVLWATGTPVPGIAGQITISNAAATGFSFAYQTGNSTPMPRYIQLTALADWFFAAADGQAITAGGGMQKVLANQTMTLQIPCSIYALASSGSTTLTALWIA